MQVAFMVAPMAMALRSQGVPVKIVYLGHRYGTAVVVAKDSKIQSVPDLVGHTMAIPTRLSDEYLILRKALKQHNLDLNSVKYVEMPPPDVPAALENKVIDGFSMGEPMPSKAEMGGYGRVLFKAQDYWPDYMSCVAVVRQDLIDSDPDAVQAIVDGIGRSGLWLDEGGPTHRNEASEFVGRYYFKQPPALLKWALTNPIDRVSFSKLEPRKADFDMVADLMVEAGLIKRRMPFEEYVDTRFADKAISRLKPWEFEAPPQ